MWGDQRVMIKVLDGQDGLAMEGGLHDGWGGLAILSRPNISTGKINCFYRHIILYQINILMVEYGKCLCT